MKSIVITFGRMNPPTVGHQKLVQKVQTTARVNRADSRIYLSHTQNNKKDPLTYDEKISLARAAFGNIVVKSNAKTIIEVSKELEKSGYTDLILVVGSDRIAEFDKLLNKYNGKEFNFNSIKVVSAGERDPDAEGVEGMSASKLRKLALSGDYEAFSTGLPPKVSDKMKKQTYDKIREVIKEETELEEDRKPLTIQQRMQRSRQFKRLQPKLQRFKKLRAKRMADEPRIKKLANKAAIAIMRKKVAGERGKDYANLPASDKMAIDRLISKKTAMIQKLAKRLIPKIRKQQLERVKKARQSTNEGYEVAQDKTIGSKPGTQPKKYYSGLSKSEKEARNAQFKRGAEKDSSDPSAYPDKHAGDTGVKTKQSKYTKKYKDMFGEKTELSKAREEIRAEKEDNKKKYDALMDRARMKDARTKNTQTTVEEFEINESAEAALRKKAEKSGISYGTLKKVYDRGMAAWRTGHRPGATQQQWAFARVNSYITKGKTYHTADSDLREEGGAGEEATDKLVKKYKKDTPCSEDAGSMKHHQFQKTFKHARQHAMKHIDKDVDSDVDKLDTKPTVPDEITGTEKVNQTPKMFAKFRKEKQHTKKGDAFEELEFGDIEDMDLTEDQTSDWKQIQSMDKGGITSGKEGVRKRLAYLNAVMSFQKKYGKDTLKTKKSIEAINRSRIAEETESCCDDCDKYFDHIVEEAEHQGRKVKLNDPFRTPSGPKKFSVYVKNDKGNVVKVNFGDPNMEIKRDDPDRRKNFRARHNCDNPGPKWKARYWSCYQWRSSAKVES